MVFVVGILGILITVSLHALVASLLISALGAFAPYLLNRFGKPVRSLIVAGSACALVVKHTLDILFWAAAFWTFAGPQFADFETAIYFSSVTYTTLGYGDVVIVSRWRLLSSMEAINGLILFGLSTALLFVLIEELWLKSTE